MRAITSIFLISLITIAIAGKSGSKSKSYKSGSKSGKKSSKSKSKSSSKSTPSPVSTDTNPTPTNDELCGCFEIDLMCSPIQLNDETCYYYQLNRVSDDDYCLDAINYLALSYGDNLDECGLTDIDINDIVLDYAPKCYGLNTQYSSANINGLQFMLDNTPSSSSYSSYGSKSSKSSKSSSKSASSRSSTRSKSKGKSKGSSSAKSSSSSTTSTDPTDFVIFSACFDSSYVGDTREDGMIEISQGNNLYTCDIPNILPNFCGGAVDTETETDTPTTAMPSVAPTYVECNSDDAMNIAFVMDESGSVDSNEWDVILTFVERIVTFDVSPASYVALYEYAALAAYQELLSFTGPMSSKEQIVIDELDNNNYTPAGQTETWDAVNRVLDDIHNYKTIDNCNDNGDSCWQRSDILFLITDGEPTGTDVCGDMATRMSQSDVDIVIILIDPNGDIDETKVSCLDIKNNGNDVIRLPSFDSDDFNAIEQRIREKICSGANPQSNGPQPDHNPWQYDDGSIGLGPIPTRSGGGQGGNADPGLVNQEIAHDAQHEVIEQESNKKINALSWEIPVGIVVFIFLIVIAGIYYFRVLKERNNKIMDENNIKNKHITQISISSIDGGNTNTNNDDNDNNIIDDICDPITPIPCSPEEAWHAQSPFDTMESPFGIIDVIQSQQSQQTQSPDSIASSEAIKMQTEINEIYAQIARTNNVGIKRHRETF